MVLTPEQLLALKTEILASNDPDVMAARGNGAEIGRNDTELARLYNLPSVTQVWRTRVEEEEFLDAYVFTEMDSLTAPKQFQLELMLKRGWLNASKPNVQAGLAEVFKAAGLSQTKTAVLTLVKRFATRAEALFVTGADATKYLTYEGELTVDDLGRAFRN